MESGSVIFCLLSGSGSPEVCVVCLVSSLDDVIVFVLSFDLGLVGTTTRTIVSWGFLGRGRCVGITTGQPWFWRIGLTSFPM